MEAMKTTVPARLADRTGPATRPARIRYRRFSGWRTQRGQQFLWAMLFLAPVFAALVLFRVFPFVHAVFESLRTGFPGGLRPSEYTGLTNYIQLFASSDFRGTLIRTLVFNVIINPLQVAIALMLALLLTQRLAGASLWRTLLFIPVAIPAVGSSVVWGVALRPEGPINALLSVVGIGAQPFLTSSSQALACIILIATWIGVGYWMVFLISGLQHIPQDLYEAAMVDGAGWWRSFFNVTLPLLRRPLLFVLVADTVANFVLFVPIQLLTGGGPNSSTTLLMFDAYRTGFSYGDRYDSAAEIVILLLVMLVFVLLQFRLLREKE